VSAWLPKVAGLASRAPQIGEPQSAIRWRSASIRRLERRSIYSTYLGGHQYQRPKRLAWLPFIDHTWRFVRQWMRLLRSASPGGLHAFTFKKSLHNLEFL